MFASGKIKLIYYILFFILHCLIASLNPSHKDKSDWLWAHCKNCWTSIEQGLFNSLSLCCNGWIGFVTGDGTSLDSALNKPVIPAPTAWPCIYD